MEINKKNLYDAPEMEIVELTLEGGICSNSQTEVPEWGEGN